MTLAQTKGGGNLLSSGIDPKSNCNYCNEEGHNYKISLKLKNKKEREPKDGTKQKTIYPNCLTCDKTNQPEERCSKGAGAHLKPEINKTEDKTTSDDTNRKE